MPASNDNPSKQKMKNVERFLEKYGQPSHEQDASFYRGFRKAANEYGKVQGERISRLEQENAKLRKDAKRLDWIEQSGGRCGQYEEGFFAHPLAQGDKYESGKTLREAIDNAISFFG